MVLPLPPPLPLLFVSTPVWLARLILLLLLPQSQLLPALLLRLLLLRLLLLLLLLFPNEGCELPILVLISRGRHQRGAAAFFSATARALAGTTRR